MNTIYFFIFCMAISYVIYWGLKNDDLDQNKDGKFSIKNKKKDKD